MLLNPNLSNVLGYVSLYQSSSVSRTLPSALHHWLPLLSDCIQVVGWFIQDQNVGSFHQNTEKLKSPVP